MEWDANPNFYVLDLPKDKINVDADIGAGVELTNSDTTVTYREPYFKDIRLSGTYTRDIFTSKVIAARISACKRCMTSYLAPICYDHRSLLCRGNSSCTTALRA